MVASAQILGNSLKKAESEPEHGETPDSARSCGSSLDNIAIDTLDPVEADWSSMIPKPDKAILLQAPYDHIFCVWLL